MHRVIPRNWGQKDSERLALQTLSRGRRIFLMAAKKKSVQAPAKIGFVEPMECLPVTSLPKGLPATHTASAQQ